MSPVSFEEADRALRAHLGDAAYGHSTRVAETAARLAVTYGADVDAARLAGLLHDWDRELPRDQLVAAAREAGISVTPDDEAAPYLLHSRMGAHDIAVALPGLPDAVVRAVSRHTIGAADASELDMIVYLADTIEPAREHHGVEKLRAKVGVVPLPELYLLGVQQSLVHVIRSRRRLHPDSVAVWNALVAGERP